MPRGPHGRVAGGARPVRARGPGAVRGGAGVLTVAVRAQSRIEVAAERALHGAVDHLLSRQDPEGWWKGELETNVTMDAEDLLLRQFLGIRTDEETRMTAAWIRSKQRDDGTWANFYGGPPEL